MKSIDGSVDLILSGSTVVCINEDGGEDKPYEFDSEEEAREFRDDCQGLSSLHVLEHYLKISDLT